MSEGEGTSRGNSSDLWVLETLTCYKNVWQLMHYATLRIPTFILWYVSYTVIQSPFSVCCKVIWGVGTIQYGYLQYISVINMSLRRADHQKSPLPPRREKSHDLTVTCHYFFLLLPVNTYILPFIGLTVSIGNKSSSPDGDHMVSDVAQTWKFIYIFPWMPVMLFI